MCFCVCRHRFLSALPLLGMLDPSRLQTQRLTRTLLPRDDSADLQIIEDQARMSLQLDSVLGSGKYAALLAFLKEIKCGYPDETAFLRTSRVVLSFCEKVFKRDFFQIPSFLSHPPYFSLEGQQRVAEDPQDAQRPSS